MTRKEGLGQVKTGPAHQRKSLDIALNPWSENGTDQAHENRGLQGSVGYRARYKGKKGRN